jgi:hypothetical protein
LSTTTPWDEDVLLDCVDDNYTYTTNEENFTWYGLRIILPEDARGEGASWFNDVATMVEDNGFQQAYGEETPVVLLNSTFLTTETNPTIRISINDDVQFESYQFFFDKVEDGEPMEKTKTFGAATCWVEQSEDGGGSWRGVADAVLTISLFQTQIREATETTSSASLAFMSSSLTMTTSTIISVMILLRTWFSL